MATAQGMSGVDLRAVVSELVPLLPLWVGKIYQYGPKLLALRLQGEDHGRYALVIESGRRAHLVKSLPPAPERPGGFAMLLRKYLEGGKVLEVVQPGLQRILTLAVGKKAGTYRLVAELFDEGNVILVGQEERIVKPLWHHRFRDREVVPGAVYTFPGKDCTDLPPDAFGELLRASDREIVKTLATECMLGGRYAEEACAMAGIGKDTPAGSVDPVAVLAAIEGLLERVKTGRDPVITPSGCWPFPLSGEPVADRFPSYEEALETYYGGPAPPPAKESRARAKREDTIRNRQEASLRKFENEIRRREGAIERIYENYSLVEEVIRVLSDAEKRTSWGEIEKTLRASDLPAAKAVVGVHPESASVTLDLGEKVRIEVRESVRENIGRMHEEIKRFRKKREGALAALARPLPAPPERRERAAGRRRRWFHRFRWFETSDGVLVVGGRDAGQNEELVRKYMGGGDTFVHADVHGAPVLIVKGATGHMDEVAQFAASYSGAWKSGHAAADVYAVRPDQVSKAAPSGEYLSTGGFSIRGERTWFRNVPLAVSIGLAEGEAPRVIGGPPGAVAKKAVHRVTLRPGIFEPNDIAKKVVRALREMIPEAERGGLRRVLSTESVAAFVPPGGSEVARE
ncbi:MAG: NFACT family protein [Methanomicrobiales archaeon]|nr:NFACT family protein [Methanomicrobiales archaeon]MDD1670656.1 NFACT family protein [Methanomicrobiales archaeon]